MIPTCIQRPVHVAWGIARVGCQVQWGVWWLPLEDCNVAFIVEGLADSPVDGQVTADAGQHFRQLATTKGILQARTAP